jgi:flagellar basal-body rod modification protein FlgD
MSISSVMNNAAVNNTTEQSAKTGYSALGQTDFLRLLTTQLQNQDPSDPVDNKEMLAQMAQFSSVQGITDMSSTLKEIATKLDAVLSAQAAANTNTTNPTA